MSERCKNCKHIIDPQWSWCTEPDCILDRIGSKRARWIEKELKEKNEQRFTH